MRRYYSPLVSPAYLFRVSTSVAAFIVPFFVSYAIDPFWLKESTYADQPSVNFKHQMIVMLEGNTPGSDVVWSTYDQLNAMMGNKFRVAEVQARQDDVNRDGKVDKISVTARVPLYAGEAIHHARFIMFFDYLIDSKVSMQMEGAAYYDHVSMVSGSTLEVWGDLKLRQRGILKQSGATRDIYNSSIIKPSNGGIDSMDQVLFTTMLDEIASRNETTIYADTTPVWVAGASTEFILKANVHIPVDQIIRYRPGVLETTRYAVLQFLAVYVFVAALLGAATHFIFENQVFETRVYDDSRPKTHIH